MTMLLLSRYGRSKNVTPQLTLQPLPSPSNHLNTPFAHAHLFQSIERRPPQQMRRRRRASGGLPRRSELLLLVVLLLLLSSSLVVAVAAFVPAAPPRLRPSGLRPPPAAPPAALATSPPRPAPRPVAAAAAGAAPAHNDDDSGAAPPPLHLQPRHLAIIPDGNGRWAQQRGLPRVAGHQEGAKRAFEVLQACQELGGIKVWYARCTMRDDSIHSIDTVHTRTTLVGPSPSN